MDRSTINRIYVSGIDGSGRRCLVSSIIHKFAVNTVNMNGNRWELSATGKGAEVLEGGELILEHIRSYKVLEDFSLEKTARDPLYELPDTAELELKIDGQLCGRTEFLNISGKSEREQDVFPDGVSVILAVVDCGKILENDSVYMEKIYRKLDMIVNSGYKKRVAFALSKADLIPQNMREHDFRDFYALFEKNTDLTAMCSSNAVVFTVRAVSAFGEDGEKVVGSDGRLLEEPDFSPWNVDRLFEDIMSLSVPMLRDRLTERLNYCNDVVKRRKGIFNSDNMRAEIELFNARKELSETVKNLYPFDNAVKYIKSK